MGKGLKRAVAATKASRVKKTKQFYLCVGDDLVPVDYGYVDGYQFGDRLLEGVMFKITVTKQNKLKAEIAPGFEDSLEGLDKKYWLKLAVEHAETVDIFEADSKSSGEDVILYDHSKSFDKQIASFESEPIF